MVLLVDEAQSECASDVRTEEDEDEFAAIVVGEFVVKENACYVSMELAKCAY